MAQGYGLWAGLESAVKGQKPDPPGSRDREAPFDKRFDIAMAEGAMRGGLQKTILSGGVLKAGL